jgi:LITAF-like zinc ribbon domain
MDFLNLKPRPQIRCHQHHNSTYLRFHSFRGLHRPRHPAHPHSASGADLFHSQSAPGQPIMMSDHPGGSPPPMQTPPIMYQQQPNGMNYQQQPGMMMHQDPNQQQQMQQQQQMYGQPPPQQYQGGPMSPGQQQQQPQQAGGAMAPVDGSQFRTATAIPNLGMGPAPVDCPSCGKRGMTIISYHPGNTTQ